MPLLLAQEFHSCMPAASGCGCSGSCASCAGGEMPPAAPGLPGELPEVTDTGIVWALVGLALLLFATGGKD